MDDYNLKLVQPRRPFSFPILVGGEERTGLVALVSTTCAGTKIVALQSDCRIFIMDIPQPPIQCAPICSALLAMEYQVMKSMFSELLCPCVKPGQMKVLKGIKISVALPTGYGKRACFQSLPLVYDQLLPKCEPATNFYYERSSTIINF